MTKLSEHFHDYEFSCPCCGKNKVAGELVAKLQELRDLIGEPIYITSGYRCKAYNDSIGGHPKSPHLPYYILINKKKKLIGCMAADIQVRSLKLPTTLHLLGKYAGIQVNGLHFPTTLAIIASNIADIRIGIYPNHLHIDIMPPNPSKYWLVKKYGDKPTHSKHEKNLAKFLKNNL